MAAGRVNGGGLRGFDYEFVSDPPDRLVCKICHFPSKNPHLSGCCGSTYCGACLDALKCVGTALSDSPLNCPICSHKEFLTIQNKQAEREVNDLAVFCSYKQKGCAWEGTISSIDGHLSADDGCQFVDLECANKCGQVVQRMSLREHSDNLCPCRKIECPHCLVIGEHRLIKGAHEEVCPKFPISCPNDCEVGQILREELASHRKECPLEIVICQFHDVGCAEKLVRKGEDEHNREKMAHHLSLTKHKLTSTESELSVAVKRVKMDESIVNSELTDKLESFFSRAVWPIKLSSQSAVSLLGTQVVPVTIKMAEFSKKKRELDEWYSPPFYSAERAYLMCLRVDPAGNDEARAHLSMWLYIMSGPYDDQLVWPMKKEFDIRILNQACDANHYSKIISFRAAEKVDGGSSRAPQGLGKSRFITQEELLTATQALQYVKDDCLYFSISA